MNAVVILTRFSLDTKTSFDYPPDVKKLYEDTRMERRFHYFESVYLPSLKNQTETFMVVIFYSPNMPRIYRDRLVSLCQAHSFIHLLPTAPRDDFSLNDHFLHLVPPQVTRIATTLLDDDDALHSSFVSRVKHFMNKRDRGTVLLSFSRGCTVDLETGDALHQCEKGLISAGLTFIFDRHTETHNVYHKPNTYRLDRVLKIVRVQDTPLMYLMTNHSTNRSRRGGWMKLSTKIDAEIHECFPFLH